MEQDRNAPIGVFDSGIGGLTVAREIMRQMPGENIIYFGDTARVPYGSKSKDTVIRYSRQIVHFLQTKEVKAIVIACNTASAHALAAIEAELEIPILGVIKAGAKTAAEATRNGQIGVIATRGTIDSGIYEKVLHQINGNYRVYGKACPLFVPLAEEGLTHDFITEEVARRYLKDLQYKDIDTLILGCTHYPLLRTILRKVMGENVTLVNPAYETAIELKQLLQEKQLDRQESTPAAYQFYVSDLAAQFQEFANSILPYDVANTEKIDIEAY
jgi:glutamate racemase